MKSDDNSYSFVRKPEPLIKMMNERDQSRYLFRVTKYDKKRLREDKEYFEQAEHGINFDQFMQRKPAFQERIKLFEHSKEQFDNNCKESQEIIFKPDNHTNDESSISGTAKRLRTLS